MIWYPALVLLWRRANRHSSTSHQRPSPCHWPHCRGGRDPRWSWPSLRCASVNWLARSPGRRRPARAHGRIGHHDTATLPDGRLHVIVIDVGQGDAILVVTPTGTQHARRRWSGPGADAAGARRALPFLDAPSTSSSSRIRTRTTSPASRTCSRRYRVANRRRSRTCLRQPDVPTIPGRCRPRAGRDAAARTGRDDVRPRSLDLAAAALPVRRRCRRAAAGRRHQQRLGRDAARARAVPRPAHRRCGAAGRSGAARTRRDRAGHRPQGRPPRVALEHVGGAACRGSSHDALISCGIENHYGHPAPSTLAHLAAHGIAALRTDRDGTSEVRADGAEVVARVRGVLAGAWPLPGASSAVVVPMPRMPLPATIGPWPFPIPTPPKRSWRATACRQGSSPTPGASPGSRPARRRSWLRLASRSTPTSSRSPPCSTTSTSWRRAAVASRTASSGRDG